MIVLIEQPFRTGLCFTADVYFFSPRVLRGPSTDRPETLPHDQNLDFSRITCFINHVFYNPASKIREGGATPQKLGAKKMQNFGQFWIISDFDREYLRNGSRYPKSADVTNYGNSSCV